MLARHFNKGNIVTADITFGVLQTQQKRSVQSDRNTAYERKSA
jgi:hypothetical protein